ncbi:hypothetical protein ACNKHS_14520 [Shigella flexneri]
MKLLGDRCKTLKEIAESCRYFYEEFKRSMPTRAKNTCVRFASAAGSGARQT